MWGGRQIRVDRLTDRQIDTDIQSRQTERCIHADAQKDADRQTDGETQLAENEKDEIRRQYRIVGAGTLGK